jgi:hypothetical protein
MAGKWELAKAFGRAITRPGASKKTVETIEKAVDDPSDLHPYFKFREGHAVGTQDALDAKQAADEAISDGVVPESKRADAERIIFDKFTNADTDDALIKDFENAFDDAAEKHGYKKWREESKDMPLDDGFGGDMHDVNRMDAEQRVREEMIRDKHTLSDDEFIDKWFDK